MYEGAVLCDPYPWHVYKGDRNRKKKETEKDLVSCTYAGDACRHRLGFLFLQVLELALGIRVYGIPNVGSMKICDCVPHDGHRRPVPPTA